MVDTIALVYKTGGDYSLEYVKRLCESLIKYDKEIVCFSDDFNVQKYCTYNKLQNNWNGWWSKIEIFRDLKSAIYFDLDTIIKGDISDIINYPHKFTMLSDLNTENKNPTSGIMAWNGDFSYIYERFNYKKINFYDRNFKYLGDQGYIGENVHEDRFQDIFPDRICSFKWSNEKTKNKSDIICYHGRPRPHETGWAI